MNKYSRLGAYLREQGKSSIPLTFAEIERIIGSALPASAFEQRAWWSNNPTNNVATREWLEAGYVTQKVDMEGKSLVFRRESDSVAEARPALWGRGGAAVLEAERPAHHPLFGAHKGAIRIAVGTDLTAPADPEWGED